MTDHSTIPTWEKYALTINEAADYFGIGQKKMRQIADEHISSDFILMNGAKHLIKRKSFEDFLNHTSTI